MSLHFLAIDDSDLNLKVTQTVLTRLGIQVDALTDVTEGYTYVSERTYDLILMDYLMPITDGITASRHIRSMTGGAHDAEYYRNIPIVLLTAEDNKDQLSNLPRDVINEVLLKPFKTTDINTVVEHLCRKPDDSIPSVHGIDPDTMEEMYKADAEGFKGLLSIFADDIAGKHARIGDALAISDYNAYTVEVHRIKGESRMIGANALAESALALEQAGKSITGVQPNGLSDADNISAIKEQTPLILNELDLIGADIRDLLAGGTQAAVPDSSPDNESPAPSSLPFDLDKLRRYVAHAAEAMDEQDYSLAREWLGEISDLIGK